MNFNPDKNIHAGANIFGLPFNPGNSKYIIIPVPWDLTASYRKGCSRGPVSIFNASFQLDLYDPFFPNAWKEGIAMLAPPTQVMGLNDKLEPLYKELVNLIEYNPGKKPDREEFLKQKINEASGLLNEYVRETSLSWISQERFPILLGGEHSTIQGYLEALSTKAEDFGILQLDAHADLRESYQGLKHSHASTMHNALDIKHITKLTQLGVRDLGEYEANFITENSERIHCFYDRDIKKRLFNGENWNTICDDIISTLPDKVYLSLDIDGLKTWLSPNTGTPVPGGIEFDQLSYLLEKIAESDKRIIGLDLTEVNPGLNEWDASVGARVLYKAITAIAKNHE